MVTEFEKKLRKFFRKCQRKNLGLGFKRGVFMFKLVRSLPLDEYQKLEPNLSADELYDLRKNLKVYELEEAFFYMIKPHTWYNRCCADMRLFDSFSDEQLGKVLNAKEGNISSLFFADGQNAGRRLRILKLLSENSLESWIKLLSTVDYRLMNVKMPEGLAIPSNDTIFKKLATLSNYAVAKLMEILGVGPARRLLQGIICLERDVFSICKEIEKNKLYEVVIVKLDLLKDADVERTAEMYSWLYSNIPIKCKFLTYLMEEKLDEIVLFDAEICGEICSMKKEEQVEDFVRKVIERKEKSGDFYEDFYQKIRPEEKEQFFQELLKDETGKRIIRSVLKKKESLSLLEALVLEKL